MSQIKLFVKNVFELNQRDFWIIILSNLVLGIFFRFFDVHEFIQAGSILFLLMKSITFYRSTSVMPSISSDFDRFSWKYFQGLPINKKDLIVALIMSNLIAMAPLYFWVLSFSPQLGELLLDPGQEVTFTTKMKVVLVSMPALIFIGLFSLQNLVKLPRQQYSKIDSKIAFYQLVRNFFVFAFVVVYGGLACLLIIEVTGIPLGSYMGRSLKFGFEILTSWWIVPISIVIVLNSYSNTLKVFQDESIGYIKQTWKPKRDLSIIAVCALFVIGPFQFLDFGIPVEYQGNRMTASAFKNDFKAIESALSKGEKINLPNEHGFTPIMVAANEGNSKMFKYLLEKGADLKGNVKLTKSFLNGMNIFSLALNGGDAIIIQDLLGRSFDVNHVTSVYGHTPLHLASKHCKTPIVDLLIEKKAYLNAVNKKNETALHWASKRKCFGTVVSLIEAGADPLIKTEKGMLAKDLINNNQYQKDLAYYLEKRTRHPAGK